MLILLHYVQKQIPETNKRSRQTNKAVIDDDGYLHFCCMSLNPPTAGFQSKQLTFPDQDLKHVKISIFMFTLHVLESQCGISHRLWRKSLSGKI